MAVMKGAEPFGFEGDETGILLVHGYTGSPQGLRPWGEHLSKEGFTVLCPRLPGHGTTIAELATSTWTEWVGEAEMALRGLNERCSSVFIGALSMGGAIALDLAERNPDVVKGLTVVNPFVYTDDPRARLAPLLGKLPLFLKGVGNDIADPSQTELCYPKFSTKATATMLAGIKKVHDNLSQVRAPALLFVSRQDHLVPTGNTQRIYDRISSENKEIIWLERSYHVATLDYDRDIIFERSTEFFREHSKS
ncbi:MAG: alpha/beta hydrolase [Actinomycetota bacterium]|nr:alpha/beta fold hydrolase [Actinomycetota bacterium]